MKLSANELAAVFYLEEIFFIARCDLSPHLGHAYPSLK